MGGGGGGKGGGGGGPQLVGYDYYASFVGVFGYGPASELIEIINDGKSIWRGSVTAASWPNPAVIDTTKGRVYFFWGTGDQNTSGTGIIGGLRGNYRHRVVALFYDWYCGFERLSVPDIRLVYRRKGVQQVITGTPTNLVEGQVNPMVALSEVLTNEITGAAIPASRLDAASWQALAETLETEQATEYLSIMLDSKITPVEFASELNGYCDTWFRTNAAGAIEAGRFLKNEAEPEGLPVLSEHDLSKPPEIVAHGIDELDDRVVLAFDAQNRAYETNYVRYDTPLGRGIREATKETEVQMPWVTRPSQAWSKATEIGQRNTTPWDELSLEVAEERLIAKGIEVGDNFVLTYAPLNYRAVCRMTRLTGWADGDGTVRCIAETERGLSTGAFAPEPEDDDLGSDPEPADLVHMDVLQATPDLAGAPYHIFFLANKELPALAGIDLWFRKNSSAAFTSLGQQIGFAVPVELSAAYPDTTSDDDESGSLLVAPYAETAGFEFLPGTQSPEEIADNNLLLIIVQPDESYEIVTVKSIESPIGDDYPIWCVRSRLGTAKLTHAAGAKAWFMYRGTLPFYTNGAFEAMSYAATAADRSVYAKLQPYTATEKLPIEDATEISVELVPQAAGESLMLTEGGAPLQLENETNIEMENSA